MNLIDDALSELVRLVIGVAVVMALVWICGRMPRTYVALKFVALATWGALSFGLPAFVFLAIYLPRGEIAIGLLAVAAAGVCMIWPFVQFGWPSLRDTIKPGATERP